MNLKPVAPEEACAAPLAAPSQPSPPRPAAFCWGDMGMEATAMSDDDDEASTLSYLVSNTTLASPVSHQWTYLS